MVVLFGWNSGCDTIHRQSVTHTHARTHSSVKPLRRSQRTNARIKIIQLHRKTANIKVKKLTCVRPRSWPIWNSKNNFLNSGGVDIIRTVYYIHKLELMKLIFTVLCVSQEWWALHPLVSIHSFLNVLANRLKYSFYTRESVPWFKGSIQSSFMRLSQLRTTLTCSNSSLFSLCF